MFLLEVVGMGKVQNALRQGKLELNPTHTRRAVRTEAQG